MAKLCQGIGADAHVDVTRLPRSINSQGNTHTPLQSQFANIAFQAMHDMQCQRVARRFFIKNFAHVETSLIT